MPALRAHIWQTVGIGRTSRTKEQFERNFYMAFPEAKEPRPGAIRDLFADLE